MGAWPDTWPVPLVITGLVVGAAGSVRRGAETRVAGRASLAVVVVAGVRYAPSVVLPSSWGRGCLLIWAVWFLCARGVTDRVARTGRRPHAARARGRRGLRAAAVGRP